MRVHYLLLQARQRAGLSQAQLATAAHTSQPTLCAYEQGQKSPSLKTAARIVEAAGLTFTLAPQVKFVQVAQMRGNPVMVPQVLPRLPVAQALARVELPLHLNWSDRGRIYDLAQRQQRARVYEIVLREGAEKDILTYVDGALLVDLWNELVLPKTIKDAWQSVIEQSGAAKE